MRNPPRPVKQLRLGSFTSNSLFGEDSELSEGLEHTELTLPILDADRCNEMIVMDTFYGNNQCDEELHNGFWNQGLKHSSLWHNRQGNVSSTCP
jgi:hypothetical protein